MEWVMMPGLQCLEALLSSVVMPDVELAAV
jgi:hypothetical protein